MTKHRVLTVVLSLYLVVGTAGAAEPDRTLSFELDHEEGSPAGWGGGPPETIRVDGEIRHGGKWSVLIERDDESAPGFSTITRAVPADVVGKQIEWRGWVRTENVIGHCGLWLREDGSSGSVAFDNMGSRSIKGTTEWTQYSVVLPLEDEAKEIYFGLLLSGTGKVWADDFELLVDGKPLSEASKRELVKTALDSDTEFDGGSGIAISRLSETQLENLSLLAKVWGFLKYHHPKATTGAVHWDYELFRVMPSLLAAESADQRNAALLDWLSRLGPMEGRAAPPDLPVEAHLMPRLDWLADREQLGSELSSALEGVHARRPALGEQFWVGMTPGVGNPDFTRELGYPRLLKSPDAGYQLLALFRLWNIIEYWFPYRDLIEEDWAGVLREQIPVFVAAKDFESYRLALLRTIARVHDTHANIWSGLESRPPKGPASLPVDIRFLDGQAVVWRLATKKPEDCPFELGDAILSIDGRSVKELVADWSPYYAASNEPTRVRDIGRNLTRGPSGPTQVIIDRGGKKIELTGKRVGPGGERLEPGRWHDREGEPFQMLGEDVAYLKLSMVNQTGLDSYVEAAAGTMGLVIDIRNYPSAFTVFALGQHLVKEPTSFVRFTTGDLSNPGAFRWSPPISLQPAAPHYEGKVVILVDEVTQSSAEYTAMAFRAAPNAIVIGSTTAAADGNVSAIPLPGGERTMISGIGVFYPDKTGTQRVGIVPDITVVPTRQGIREGRDEVLERALREILGQAASKRQIRRLTAVKPPEP